MTENASVDPIEANPAESIAQRLRTREDDLLGVAYALRRVLAFQRHFAHLTRRKPFRIAHLTAWSAILSERHMVAVDFSSWGDGMTKHFLKGVHASELELLKSDRVTPGMSKEDDFARRYLLDARAATFARLFPNAVEKKRKEPSKHDVAELRHSLFLLMEPVRHDRNAHRAHRLERDPSRHAEVKAVDLTDMVERFEKAREITRDLRLLVDGSQLMFPSLIPSDDDVLTRDLVDLVLCGPIQWTAKQWSEAGERDDRWEQRRTAFYEMLHSRHDQHGDSNVLFNESPQGKQVA